MAAPRGPARASPAARGTRVRDRARASAHRSAHVNQSLGNCRIYPKPHAVVWDLSKVPPGDPALIAEGPREARTVGGLQLSNDCQQMAVRVSRAKRDVGWIR